jgi:hypothetical protein
MVDGGSGTLSLLCIRQGAAWCLPMMTSSAITKANAQLKKLITSAPA